MVTGKKRGRFTCVYDGGKGPCMYLLGEGDDEVDGGVGVPLLEVLSFVREVEWRRA